MLRGIGDDTSGVEVAPVSGGCGTNFDGTYKFSDQSGSFIGGGFMGGLSAWFQSPLSDWQNAKSAALAADPNALSPPVYSVTGAFSNLGPNVSSIFDVNAWVCDPSYQIGHIVPPLAVVLILIGFLKRGRR